MSDDLLTKDVFLRVVEAWSEFWDSCDGDPSYDPEKPKGIDDWLSDIKSFTIICGVVQRCAPHLLLDPDKDPVQ